MTRVESRGGSIQAVARALDVLILLGLHERNVSEVAQELGVDKSTASRLLGTLRGKGFAARDSGTGMYRLGPRIGALGHQYVEQIRPGHETDLLLDHVATRLGETVTLTALDGQRVICVDKRDSRQPLRISSQVGRSLPLHCGASGKAVLAFLPPEEARRFLASGPLERLTPRTIADPDELLAELARIRSQGYAVSIEEVDEGVVGVGVPLLDWNGRPVASIGVSVPVTRFDPEKLAAIVDVLREAVRGWEHGTRSAASYKQDLIEDGLVTGAVV